jgi:hypothetical protein
VSCCTFLLALWPSYFLELCSRLAPAAAELEIFPSEDRRARQRCRRGAAHRPSAEKGAAHRPSAEKGAAHRRSERRQLSPTSKTRKSRKPREVPCQIQIAARSIQSAVAALVAARGGQARMALDGGRLVQGKPTPPRLETARSCIRAARSSRSLDGAFGKCEY